MSDRSYYSGYSDQTSGSYAPPNGRHNGGVYREIDPREDRSQRFAAHVLTGPFNGFGNKKSSRHSSSSHKDHHGSSRSSRSSTSSSSRYTSSSSRSQQQQQAQFQQQQFQQQQYQQQQPRYPGPQPGYRPAGGHGYGSGYGPGVQQQQPNVYGKNQQDGPNILVRE
ncbi:hypothetical protein G7054_g14040 [Neopestalotiopsis clavispora]|nr:hypothetical protein G7054_g14040 [Neopestalotiopsis clavispora]